LNRRNQNAAIGYRSYKHNESQEALGAEHLIQKEKENAYSTPNDIDAKRSTRGNRGYRNPLYTSSTVKVRETYDRTTGDGNVYDKAGTGTDTGTGTGGEVELAAESKARRQLNTSGIRRNGQSSAERVSSSTPSRSAIPLPAPYSTRETFEERTEEKYHVEEEASKSGGGSDHKELL
uniref:Uncharacterized protein n=1 Tax=Gongylonema pulchrum TaxID=637853 RepID=A0A183DDL6_9BILA